MSSITKIIVAALTLAAVQAAPQPYDSKSASTSATVTVSSAAPSATASQDSFVSSLLTEPTAIKRFQKLLTQGKTLLTGDALRKVIVFPFDSNTPPPAGSFGGVAVPAVSTYNP